MRGARVRVVLGFATLLMVAAACGGDSNDPGGGGTSTGSTGSTEATEGGDDPGAGSLYGGDDEETTGPTGATDTGAGDADVSVSLNNYLFDPGTVEVSSGDVVAVRNGNTRTPHTFTVVDEDVDLELAPLATETTTIDLAPGTYELICRFHESLGMTGTLKVT
jgi:plastocyanin